MIAKEQNCERIGLRQWVGGQELRKGEYLLTPGDGCCALTVGMQWNSHEQGTSHICTGQQESFKI